MFFLLFLNSALDSTWSFGFVKKFNFSCLCNVSCHISSFIFNHHHLRMKKRGFWPVFDSICMCLTLWSIDIDTRHDTEKIKVIICIRVVLVSDTTDMSVINHVWQYLVLTIILQNNNNLFKFRYAIVLFHKIDRQRQVSTPDNSFHNHGLRKIAIWQYFVLTSILENNSNLFKFWYAIVL
jgi:hypothetical protein